MSKHPLLATIPQRSSAGTAVLPGWWAHLRQLLPLWGGMRVFTLVLAAVVSSLKPINPAEVRIAVWPPSLPVGAWLERVVLQPWLRWDTSYFVRIAEQGYRRDDGTAQFHLLYPFLGRIAGMLFGGNALAGLLLVSSLATLVALVLFERLALLDLPPRTARRATLLFVFWPNAFVLWAAYTEALFLVWCIAAVLAARQGRWWWAGLAGGLACLTRQQGLFLLVPLGWEALTAVGGWRNVLRGWRTWLSLVLVPGGYALWLAYRAVVIQDLVINTSSLQTLIYSLLISPSANLVVKVQGFVWPWVPIRAAFHSLQRPGLWATALDLIFGGLALGLLLWGGRALWRLRPSYLLHSVVMLLVSFAYYTGPNYPYMGLPRHCLLAFPLVLPLALWTQHRSRQHLMMLLGLMGLTTLLFFSIIATWIP